MRDSVAADEAVLVADVDRELALHGFVVLREQADDIIVGGEDLRVLFAKVEGVIGQAFVGKPAMRDFAAAGDRAEGILVSVEGSGHTAEKRKEEPGDGFPSPVFF